ncbi:hypothetical protein IID23_04360 [Patescibacteria group bacterium]|nr:hypothetical protein [Patescibacteria group bacterium]
MAATTQNGKGVITVVTTELHGEAVANIEEAVRTIQDEYGDGLLTVQERDDRIVILYFEWVERLGRSEIDPIFDQLGAHFTTKTIVQWSEPVGA